MKKLELLLLPVLCLSCTLTLPTEENDFCESVFTIRGETKAMAATDAKETNIKHWAVMLFDMGNPGAWFYSSSDDNSDITCTVRKGRPYRAYAIANYPKEGTGSFSPSIVTGEDHLLQYASALSSNSSDGLVMFGSKELPHLPSGKTSIPLNRLCSKVSIESIRIDMEDPVYACQDFVLNAIYLINVYTGTSFGGDHSTPNADAQFWYNAKGWHGSGSMKALDALLGDRGLGVAIPDGSSYNTVHTFYAYPNSIIEDNSGDDWCPRHTRLVIEGTLGGKKYYYTITLPEMKRNNSYTVTEALLKRPGALDPEKPVPGILDATITITEDTWDSDYYTSELS